ncbi:MAG: hypothetical protein RMJ65_07135, partial [candidate division WOR-3 bacterium]|nr:hypothetical protein [candidate division WOR-3 bacterium]
SGQLGGTLTGTITQGTHTITLSGVTYNTIENGVQIRVERTSGDNLTPGISAPFNVYAQASQLVFVGVPARSQVNKKMASFKVEARRTDNSVDSNYIGTVTISKATGPGNVFGTLEKPLQYGVALFDSVEMDTPGEYTLSASTPGLPSATSPTITVIAQVFPWVENFEYIAGTSVGYNGWSPHSSSGANPILVVEPGLTYSGYVSSGIGNAAKIDTTGEDVNRTYTSQTSGTIYAAFMVNIDAATAGGDYFFHLSTNPLSTTYFDGRVYVKKDASNNLAFGLSKRTETAIYTDFVYSLNTTYLVVLKYEIVSGTQNDKVSLFIFSSGVPPTEPVTPTIGPLSPANADPTNIGSVALRQGTAANAPRVIIDGIRIATSWLDALGIQPGVATQLAITSVNNGVNPSVNIPFNVVVQAQDALGNPAYVTQNTDVQLFVHTGSGQLGGTLTGTITQGTQTITLSGVT